MPGKLPEPLVMVGDHQYHTHASHPATTGSTGSAEETGGASSSLPPLEEERLKRAKGGDGDPNSTSLCRDHPPKVQLMDEDDVQQEEVSSSVRAELPTIPNILRQWNSVRSMIVLGILVLMAVVVALAVFVGITVSSNNKSSSSSSSSNPTLVTFELIGVQQLLPDPDTIRALEEICANAADTERVNNKNTSSSRPKILQCHLNSQKLVDDSATTTTSSSSSSSSSSSGSGSGSGRTIPERLRPARRHMQQQQQQQQQTVLQVVMDVAVALTDDNTNFATSGQLKSVFEDATFVENLEKAHPFFATLTKVLIRQNSNNNNASTRTPSAAIAFTPVPSVSPTGAPCQVCRTLGDQIGTPDGIILWPSSTDTSTCSQVQELLSLDSVSNITTDTTDCFAIQASAAVTCGCTPPSGTSPPTVDLNGGATIALPTTAPPISAPPAPMTSTATPTTITPPSNNTSSNTNNTSNNATNTSNNSTNANNSSTSNSVWDEAEASIETLLGSSLNETMNRYYWEAWQWMRFRDPLSRQWPEMMTTTANSSSSWFQQRWLLAYWYFATTDNATRPWPFCNPPNVLDADVENDDDACIYQKLVAAGTIETANQYMKVPWIRFLTNRSECDWVGVTCSQDGVVEALDYTGFNISGTTPNGFQYFSNLLSLQLDFNMLEGTLPSVWGTSFPNLTRLSLQSNQLTGSIPSSFYNLKYLQRLDLGQNGLTGTIAAEIVALKNLTLLALHENALVGTIPSSIGDVPSLAFVHLYENRFTGTLPSALGSIPNLKDFRAGGNMLTGSIPETLGSLTSLEVLRLDRNRLSGSVPASLSMLTKLNEVDLSQNLLSGPLTPGIGQWTSLSRLYFNKNSFTGEIPTTIGGLSRLISLDLSFNFLNGPIPSALGSLTSLEELVLNNNLLTGTVPTELALLFSIQLFRIESNVLVGFPSQQLCPILINVAASYADCDDQTIECVTFCCTTVGGCVCQFETTDPSRCVQ